MSTKNTNTKKSNYLLEKRNKKNKDSFLFRLRASRIILWLIIVAVALRLVWIQAVDYNSYAKYGTTELVHDIPLPALRGDFYDRFGNILAMSQSLPSVVADDFLIKNPQLVATQLSPILEVPANSLVSLLSEKTGFVYLKRFISSSVEKQILNLNLPGITVVTDQERFYPQKDLTLGLVGLTNPENQGISGLELSLNSLLSGESGLAQEEIGINGTVLPNSYHVIKPARDGTGVVLTIDEALQFQVEQDLANEVLNQDALSGTAVVTDPKNGEILAMVSVDKVNLINGSLPPGYNSQAALAKNSTSAIFPSTDNRAVTMAYEPGSVLKIATMAGALTEGIVTPNTIIQIPPDLNLYGDIFHDAENHGAEALPVTQVLAQSSNIGTIEIAQKLGPAALYHWLVALGFHSPTGLNFPGETIGILNPWSQWSGTAIGSTPIGQDSASTPLQILDAYNSVANDGVMETPRLVAGISDANGNVIKKSAPSGKKVLSPQVALELRQMMTQVVVDGTGVEAQIPGYQLAGKTGTSQIPNPSQSGYLAGQYMATFVGMVPANNPQLSAIVSLTRPNVIYGGSVAAPVFQQIMTYALHRYRISPSGN